MDIYNLVQPKKGKVFTLVSPITTTELMAVVVVVVLNVIEVKGNSVGLREASMSLI
jgi:hypothetical protein